MKISSVFFFRYYLSFLFIFIIESDENTDNREEHHSITGRNIEEEVTRTFKRLCVYILCISPKKPTKSSDFS